MSVQPLLNTHLHLLAYDLRQGTTTANSSILHACSCTDRFQGDKISLEVIERAIAKRTESVQAVELLEVIGAFQVPKISYDQVGVSM